MKKFIAIAAVGFASLVMTTNTAEAGRPIARAGVGAARVGVGVARVGLGAARVVTPGPFIGPRVIAPVVRPRVVVPVVTPRIVAPVVTVAPPVVYGSAYYYRY